MTCPLILSAFAEEEDVELWSLLSGEEDGSPKLEVVQVMAESPAEARRTLNEMDPKKYGATLSIGGLIDLARMNGLAPNSQVNANLRDIMRGEQARETLKKQDVSREQRRRTWKKVFPTEEPPEV